MPELSMLRMILPRVRMPLSPPRSAIFIRTRSTADRVSGSDFTLGMRLNRPAENCATGNAHNRAQTRDRGGASAGSHVAAPTIPPRTTGSRCRPCHTARTAPWSAIAHSSGDTSRRPRNATQRSSATAAPRASSTMRNLRATAAAARPDDSRRLIDREDA